MRRSTLLLPIFTLTLVACRDAKVAATNSSCDLAAVDELAKQLAGADPSAQVEMVWPALGDACKDLPPYTRAFFDSSLPQSVDESGRVPLLPQPDEATLALRRKACPDLEVTMRAVADAPADERSRIMFVGCEFERFGVVSEDQARGDQATVMTWVVHQWMLDAGVPEGDAQTISRALHALERLTSSPFGRPRDLDLPRASGVPLDDGIPVVVSRREIRFNEQIVARLDDGELSEHDVRNHLIWPLYEVFADEIDKYKQVYAARGEDWDERLIIMADANTPFATIVDLMYTGGRAELSRYGFVVSAGGYERVMLPVSPPRYTAPTASDRGSGIYAMRGPKEAIPEMARKLDPDMAGHIVESPGVIEQVMSIELTTEGMTLGRGGSTEGEPVAVPRGASDAITAYAEAIKRDDPEATQVAISADGDVPLQDVLSAIVAARGPECGIDGDGCVLPEVVIMSGHAHGYRVPVAMGAYAVGNDDEDVWGGLTGTEIGEAYGVGGLGLIGTGRGDTGDGTIGLGNTGLIGKGGGAGFGGRGTPVPRVRQAKATVSGNLDSDIIRRIVRAHIVEVRSCYNAGLTKDPELAGRVAIEFTINSKGSVGASSVQSSNLDEASSVANCVAKAVKRWKFPKPRGGGEVTVIYPFNLEPG